MSIEYLGFPAGGQGPEAMCPARIVEIAKRLNARQIRRQYTKFHAEYTLWFTNRRDMALVYEKGISYPARSVCNGFFVFGDIHIDLDDWSNEALDAALQELVDTLESKLDQLKANKLLGDALRVAFGRVNAD